MQIKCPENQDWMINGFVCLPDEFDSFAKAQRRATMGNRPVQMKCHWWCLIMSLLHRKLIEMEEIHRIYIQSTFTYTHNVLVNKQALCLIPIGIYLSSFAVHNFKIRRINFRKAQERKMKKKKTRSLFNQQSILGWMVRSAQLGNWKLALVHDDCWYLEPKQTCSRGHSSPARVLILIINIGSISGRRTQLMYA